MLINLYSTVISEIKTQNLYKITLFQKRNSPFTTLSYNFATQCLSRH